MPSTAITAQRSVLRVASAEGTPLTITGITAANPPVVTYTGTDPVNGDIVKIAGVVGMVEVNGRAFVVANVNGVGDTFELRGVDGTGYTAYVSGGTATPQTMTRIGNVKDFDITPDEAAEIDTTNLDSTRKEYLIGLPGSWNMTAAMDIDAADTGQVELEQAQNDGLSRVFTLTLSNARVFAGVGFVKSFSAAGSPDAVVGGSMSVRGTGQPSWFV